MRLWGFSPVHIVFWGQVIWINKMRGEDISVKLEVLVWELHCLQYKRKQVCRVQAKEVA